MEEFFRVLVTYELSRHSGTPPYGGGEKSTKLRKYEMGSARKRGFFALTKNALYGVMFLSTKEDKYEYIRTGIDGETPFGCYPC